MLLKKARLLGEQVGVGERERDAVSGLGGASNSQEPPVCSLAQISKAAGYLPKGHYLKMCGRRPQSE